MIYNLYRSYQPTAIFVLPIWVFALWYWGWPLNDERTLHPIYFFDTFIHFLNSNRMMSSICGTLLTFIGAMIANQLFNRHHFLDKDTYLPAFVYSLGMISIPGNLMVMPIHFGMIFLLLALTQLFSIGRAEIAKKQVFNAGFFIGVATFFSPGLWIYFLLPWFALAIIRPFVWREYLLSLIGVLVPILYIIVYFIGINEIDRFFTVFFDSDLYSETTFSSVSWIKWTSISVFILVTMLSTFRLLGSANSSGLRFKKLVRLLFSLFILSIISPILDYFQVYPLGGTLLITIPLSFILPFFFANNKIQFFSKITFYLAILLICTNFFLNLYK